MKEKLSKQKRGLTLVEIMFTCSCLVIIIVVIANIFNKNLSSYKKVTAADQRREECRFAMEAILAELREASNVTAPSASGNGSTVAFTRSGGGAKRAGEQVTYSYDSAKRAVTRTSDKSAQVTVLQDVDTLIFTRNAAPGETIDVNISVPGIASGSSFSFHSMATIRKLALNYTVSGPTLTTERVRLHMERKEMGGIR